jgi:2-hydroxychromene-2-carboxylate isomerase
MTASTKTSWKVFVDLQCPYSRILWTKLPAIRERFQDRYDITVHLTSLAFHPQAFMAQCAANLIQRKLGDDAKLVFINACYEKQERFMNAAIGDARKSDIEAVFATIAQEAGLLEGSMTLNKDIFLSKINDWDDAVWPAYTEHKVALAYGVYASPKHVIHETLVQDTESAWGPDEWAEKLQKENL